MGEGSRAFLDRIMGFQKGILGHVIKGEKLLTAQARFSIVCSPLGSGIFVESEISTAFVLNVLSGLNIL